jgi:hypothetical protein
MRINVVEEIAFNACIVVEVIVPLFRNAPVEIAVTGLISENEFHSLHSGQHPSHLTVLYSQLAQEKKVFCFVMNIK